MDKINQVDISIVILSYNSKSDLERLLPSIYASEGNLNYEVIVVDNGSIDKTINFLETDFDGRQNLFLIKNQNLGFAHGNNLGIRRSRGKYLLILNPDTVLEKNTLKIMFDFMEARPEVGISTCKVILPNGNLDLACRRRFPNPWNSFKRLFLRNNTNYNFTDVDENQSIEIDSCMGAFMFVRNLQLTSHAARQATYNSQLLFDESFFMYGEDLDLCWRVKELGHKVWYYPKTFITHYKGSSSRKTPFKALKWFHDAMWIFYKKHYAQKYPFLLNWIVCLGIYLRFSFLVLINSLKKNPKVSG